MGKLGQDISHMRGVTIRAILSVMLLSIFCVLLVLIFFVELPGSMETLSSVLLGALVGNLTSCLGYWFDSTESADHHIKKKHENNQEFPPQGADNIKYG